MRAMIDIPRETFSKIDIISTPFLFSIRKMEKNVKQSERGENTMADLLATFALLTFAGVEAAYRAKEKDNKE